jgi:hypothetical protein
MLPPKGTSKSFLRVRSFAPLARVGVFSGVHRRRNGFLLASHDFLAALDEILGALAKFPRLFLGVIAAFIGLRGEVFAGIFTGFRGEKNANQCANSQSNQEHAYLRSNIVTHESTSESHSSIGIRDRQGKLNAAGKPGLRLSFELIFA